MLPHVHSDVNGNVNRHEACAWPPGRGVRTVVFAEDQHSLARDLGLNFVPLFCGVLNFGEVVEVRCFKEALGHACKNVHAMLGVLCRPCTWELSIRGSCVGDVRMTHGGRVHGAQGSAALGAPNESVHKADTRVLESDRHRTAVT